MVPAPPLTARRLLEASEALLSPKSGTVAIVSTQNGTTQFINPKATFMAAGGGSICTTTEVKDATLIELLKRGTKVAVKRTCSDPGQLAITTQTTTSQQSTTATRTVVLPASLNSAPSTPGNTPPLALSITNASSTEHSVVGAVSRSDSSPLSLTISQAPSGGADVFTLAYSTDATGAAAFFSDNDVYSVSDTTMLLQAVDSIQLLQDSSSTEHLDEIASLSDYSTINEQSFTPSRQLQAVLDSPLPESLAEFSALHSKDFILYSGSASNNTTSINCDHPNSQASNSPLPSPLSYPTPPASHEPVAQASPFLDDSRHFSDASSFFDDKRASSATNFLDDGFFKSDAKDVKLSDEKILALKNELLDENHDLFRSNKNILDDHCHELFKSEDSFFVEESTASKPSNSSSASAATAEEVDSASKMNLDFLDEAQAFINESRNASSPLSNAFFSGTMSTAEEVKEALEEVLPSDEDVVIAEADIDLYYLNGLSSLQSQMMPNSDDPLLSSSPKDFAHRQHQKFLFEQQLQQSLLTNQQQSSNSTFSPPSAKKLKTEADAAQQSPSAVTASDTNKIPLTVQTEQIPKDNHQAGDSVFLSPSSISSNSSNSSSSSPKLQHALLRKRSSPILPVRKAPIYHSKLRKSTSSTVPVTHYTPQPMLNPGRTASGLYSTITSSLANHSTSVSDSTVDDTSDIFSEPPLPIRPRINLGNDYQATIPECSRPSYHHLNQHPDVLYWDPLVSQSDQQIARFVELTRSSAVPLGCHSEENSLKSLLEAQGEVHIAILNLLQTPPSGMHRRWAPGEMEQFIRGLELYGKDFCRIASDLLPGKTTADCVQLYYFWKKLCVDYKTTHLLQHGDNSMKFINLNANPVDDLLLDHMGYTSNSMKSSLSQQTGSSSSSSSSSTGSDVRPHVCEVPDCSAVRIDTHFHTTRPN